MIDADFTLLESDEDFLPVFPVFDDSGSRTTHVAADLFDGRVTVHWSRNGVLVKITPVVVGNEQSTSLEVDVKSSNFVLFADFDDLLGHWWVLIRGQNIP